MNTTVAGAWPIRTDAHTPASHRAARPLRLRHWTTRQAHRVTAALTAPLPVHTPYTRRTPGSQPSTAGTSAAGTSTTNPDRDPPPRYELAVAVFTTSPSGVQAIPGGVILPSDPSRPSPVPQTANPADEAVRSRSATAIGPGSSTESAISTSASVPGATISGPSISVADVGACADVGARIDGGARTDGRAGAGVVAVPHLGAGGSAGCRGAGGSESNMLCRNESVRDWWGGDGSRVGRLCDGCRATAVGGWSASVQPGVRCGQCEGATEGSCGVVCRNRTGLHGVRVRHRDGGGGTDCGGHPRGAESAWSW
ncbi:hypothetical protein DFR69_118124 [Nocardia neocaledoniensis]|uniref:Uncharacterized protein n=1 Tax=Nocardia neocaledoniensis TaxID=236511 RepID=A0A317N329_9NOCA|nr:hypothetical protein DFR69_118124 [Nocardia neocaledoniensis]